MVPKLKNWEKKEIKEKALSGVINNPDIFKVKEKEIDKFVEDYAESSEWKDEKIIKSLAHQTNSNIVVIDSNSKDPIIEKVSNNPDATLILGRNKGRYFSCIPESEGKSKIEKMILEAPISREKNNFQKVINIEDQKRIADPVIRKMDKRETKLSKEKKHEELKQLKIEFDKFKDG